MQPERIVIFHAAAIGDAVLATPVAVNLKRNYPAARITYVTHPSLVPLLLLCKAVDDFHTYDREEGVWAVRWKIAKLNPDLIVDLSGSSKSFLQTELLARKVLHYKKQKHGIKPAVHATDNFLATLAPLNLQPPAVVFPTLAAESAKIAEIRNLFPPEKPIVALVPGVGSARPSRSWPEDLWMGLARHILRTSKYSVVMVGGLDEKALCSRIADFAGGTCMDLSGKLSLPETAALLASCRLVVSADTGPAHIAVGVGTPVVGLYGPTLVERSGPYGNEKNVFDAGHHCQCQALKHCTIAGEGKSGACMNEIHPEDVFARLTSILEGQSFSTS